MTSIPLGTYAAAIKRIIPLIDEGKIDQATVDLNDVLDTLVIETTFCRCQSSVMKNC
jgi:YfdX protein